MPDSSNDHVLVTGVYLPGIPNYSARISADLLSSRNWRVDLRWAAIGEGPTDDVVLERTAVQIRERVPKFALINQLLSKVDLDRYAFVVVIDDDIELPDDFLDRFLGLQSAYELTLAAPARTHDSFIDHYFVAQLMGVAGRRTRFVEIGPVFSIRRDGFGPLLPFDEEAPMGWGLDFVWPACLEKLGQRLGIIDATAVRHSLRKPVSGYDYDETNRAMRKFLDRNEHLSPAEAFLAIESYSMVPASAVEARS